MIYRNLVNGRFKTFETNYSYSHILTGFSPAQSDGSKLKYIIEKKLRFLHKELEDYICKNPDFKTTHRPWAGNCETGFIKNMIDDGKAAGVGPMASVAGVLSDELLTELLFLYEEGFIENGGDISLCCSKEINLTLYPGWGSFSEKVLLRIPAGKWGIASSSGRYGHSFSAGRADLVSVVADNGGKADAFATTIGNQVRKGCHPESIIELYKDLPAVCIIWEGKLYYRGLFEILF